MTIYPQNQALTLPRFKQFIVLGSGVTFNYLAAVCATTLYLQTSLFSFNHFLAPHVGMAESIGMIADQLTTVKFVLFIFMFMNLLLFLFNLLPIPYFDGGQMISLYIDPLLNKLGLSEKILERIKILINQLVGILLLFTACVPLMNEAYHLITNHYLSLHDLVKASLIIVGGLLIQRLLVAFFKSTKKRL